MAKKKQAEEQKSGGESREQKSGETREDRLERIKKLGVRTKANSLAELRAEALREAQAEDFKSSNERPSRSGPDPYNLPKAESAHAEAIGEAKEADAEVVLPGEVRTDTGLKIKVNPDRLGADDKVELPRAKSPHEEATATAPKKALSAEKNVGAVSVEGGGKHE